MKTTVFRVAGVHCVAWSSPEGRRAQKLAAGRLELTTNDIKVKALVTVSAVMVALTGSPMSDR